MKFFGGDWQIFSEKCYLIYNKLLLHLIKLIFSKISALTSMVSKDRMHINKRSLEFTLNFQGYWSEPKEFANHCFKLISAEQW